MDLRFEHLLLFAIGDFDRDAGLADAVAAMQALGARVLAFGVGSAAVKKALRAREIDADGVGRYRSKAMAAVEGMFGIWDAILFSEGWQDVVETVAANEREQAFLDVRKQRPILQLEDPQYKFLRTPAAWAAFSVARAAGARPEDAKEFVRQQSRGHKKKNSDRGTGRPTRTPKAVGRNSG